MVGKGAFEKWDIPEGMANKLLDWHLSWPLRAAVN